MLNILESNSVAYRKIIHQVLNVVCEHFIIVGSELEYDEYYGNVFPQHYITNDNRKREGKAFIKKLQREINDEYLHEVTPLKKYVLYHIIQEVDLGADGTFIISDVIEESLKNINTSKFQDFEIVSLSAYDTPIDLIDPCFEDIDFLMVPQIYEIYKFNPQIISNFLHIDLDYYSELIPPDILLEYINLKKRLYKNDDEITIISTKEQFYHLVQESISNFKSEIEQKQGANIINNTLGKAPEKIVQTLFSLFARIFFKNTNILILPEPDTGRGKVDFHFSIGEDLQSFVEFKLDSHSYYQDGLRLQLPTYINTSTANHGFSF